MVQEILLSPQAKITNLQGTKSGFLSGFNRSDETFSDNHTFQPETRKRDALDNDARSALYPEAGCPGQYSRDQFYNQQ